MSKRRRGRGSGMFDNLEDVPSLEQTSDEIFGGQAFPNTPQVRVKYIALDVIKPDPIQPRRAVPSEVRSRWNPETDTIEDLFKLWALYMDASFDLATYLSDGVTDRTRKYDDEEPFEPNGIQTSFLRLLDLAASIAREGLTNPITVSRIGNEFMIETGERRWLAYQLLNSQQVGDNDWSKIPARVMPLRSIWRQATENNARQNLNAVSRARQLAILLMEIHGWDHFKRIETFEHEQEFYAQVGDGYRWTIPRDKTELLLKAMGLNNPAQLRQYRAVLRIERELWELADEYDMTENAIRQAVKQRQSRPRKDKYGKLSNLGKAIALMQNNQVLFSKQAKKAKLADRMQWQEFAKQQAEWWQKFADELDND